jgi:hypothetical protein
MIKIFWKCKFFFRKSGEFLDQLRQYIHLKRTLRQVTDSYTLEFKFNFQRRKVSQLNNGEKRHAPIRLTTGENPSRYPAHFQGSYEDNAGGNIDIREMGFGGH